MSSKKAKKQTMVDKIPNNRGELLEVMIRLTKKAITAPELESQQFLIKQLDRLEKELETWKASNK